MTTTKKPALPTMLPVISDMLESIGHHGDTLTVKFKKGNIFQYAGVTREQFTELSGAKSIGRHFMSQIRNNFKGVPFDADPAK